MASQPQSQPENHNQYIYIPNLVGGQMVKLTYSNDGSATDAEEKFVMTGSPSLPLPIFDAEIFKNVGATDAEVFKTLGTKGMGLGSRDASPSPSVESVGVQEE
jgi:hypothetical protein